MHLAPAKHQKILNSPLAARNSSVPLTMNGIRKVADSLHDSDCICPNQSGSRPKSARSQRESLLEKYEILAKFFDSLDTWIRLLRLKGSSPTFANIFTKVESLSDRRFSHSQLAQIKFILHDFIAIKRALVFDERTSSMKPDLHICINVDAIGNDGKLKSGSAIANMHLRKIFRARLADFSKSHPEVDEIRKEILPEPFNRLDAHSNTRKVPNLSLETPIEALRKQQLAASHLPGSFRMSFSRKVACNDGENASQNLSKTSIQALVVPVSELPFHNSSPKEETAAAPSPGEFLFEPASNRESVAFSASTACFPSSCPPATPSKEFNASARLMNVTPALHSPKRYMSPEGKSSPNKLFRLPPSRSWKFGTPGKDGIGKPHDYFPML